MERFAKQTSRIHLFCRHSEQMKALVVLLGNSRGISLPQSIDQGALTEKQKGMVHRLST
jgi:hypothetical protein